VKTLKREKTAERAFPSSRAYWIRFLLGIAAGLMCGILRLGVEGLVVGTAIYFTSFLILLLAYHLGVGGQGRVYYTIGLGTYLAVWFTTWILVNTLKSY
jgi:hypothetical protein